MDGYRLGARIFLFLFNDWTLPLHSVSTDLLGAVLEKTTCKRFIPPTQDSGVTLSIIGVYFTLSKLARVNHYISLGTVRTCSCSLLKPLQLFFRLDGLLRTVVPIFFLFLLHFIVTLGLLKFDSVISVTSGIFCLGLGPGGRSHVEMCSQCL